MVRKKFTSIASLLVIIVCMVFIVFFNNQSLVSASIVSSPIYVSDDTTMIYESGMVYEDGNIGYLDVGYQGTFGFPLEAQVLLKFNLPPIPAGYEVETANLYLPITGGTLQATTAFSLKVSTSINHNWTQDAVTSPPAPTSGSTQSRTLANNVTTEQPTLSPFNFTSYISGEFAKTNPRATFILSGMTAAEAQNAGISALNYYIQMTESNMSGNHGPYLIITYSEIIDIQITGVDDGGLYNTNVTPQFNIGTATLNGAAFSSGTSISVEGSYTLIVTAGSQSETIQFRIDKTPPTGTVIVNQGNQYTNIVGVSVSVTPDQGVNDITHIRYSVNGNPFIQIPYVPSFMLSIGTVNGEKVLSFKLVDGAGNESPEYQRTIILDTVVPTGSVVINNGNACTTNPDVMLNLSLDSGVTDLVGVQFSNNNSNWSGVEAFSPTKSYTLPPGDGSKTVYVRFIDHAGNVGTAQASIILNTLPPMKYTVSYDKNGATGGLVPIDSQTYENGNSVIVANNTGSLVKTGFTFNGWNTNADGSGTSYVANDIFNISAANVILYAVWNINHYTLSFESNGGSAVATQNKSYNKTATEPSAPTKSGYTFGGWYKEITFVNQWNFTKDLVTANTTLYAKWVENSLSGNNGGGYNPTSPQNSFSDPTTNTSPAPKPSQEPEPTPDVLKPALSVVTFDDLSGHWAKEMIEELASQGIIMGYPDGSFHPNESIERQHMAQIFMRAFKLEPTREVASFSDVSPNNPNYGAITLLQQAGILDGSNGKFNPNASLTRAQMAKIVALALGIGPGEMDTFQDVPSTHWGYAYIAALAELEIVLGDNGKFKPDEAVTRAQFVAIMYRALKLIK